jgi:hypothetical protein
LDLSRLIARATKIGNMRGRGYWRESGGGSLTPDEAYDIWASYAYDTLIRVARSYYAVIEVVRDLAEREASRGLSADEQRMLTKARLILLQKG